MGGFRKGSNNVVFEQNLFSLIVLHISECCKSMHISENMRKIDEMQRKLLVGIKVGGMQLVSDEITGFNYYKCAYKVNGRMNLELTHLFYDFSSAV